MDERFFRDENVFVFEDSFILFFFFFNIILVSVMENYS